MVDYNAIARGVFSTMTKLPKSSKASGGAYTACRRHYRAVHGEFPPAAEMLRIDTAVAEEWEARRVALGRSS